jgi:hypothetical protein
MEHAGLFGRRPSDVDALFERDEGSGATRLFTVRLAMKLGGRLPHHVRCGFRTSAEPRLAERADHRTGELDVGGPRIGNH